jgi:protein involved in polysaccharide export with SLBB domain
MRILSIVLGMFGIAVFLLGGSGRASASDGLRQSEADQQTASETVVVQAPPVSDYKLGPGDKVHITVYDETDLSGDFQVDSLGYVRLPLIGQIKASGSSAYQLEGAVSDALHDGYLKNPRVAIEVSTYRPFYILGQVNKPGQYSYVSNMSALDAVALAGGYTDRAIESSLYIRHENETKEHQVAADETVKVQPGDVVRVDQTVFWSVASVLAPIGTAISPVASAAYLLRP